MMAKIAKEIELQGGRKRTINKTYDTRRGKAKQRKYSPAKKIKYGIAKPKYSPAKLTPPIENLIIDVPRQGIICDVKMDGADRTKEVSYLKDSSISIASRQGGRIKTLDPVYGHNMEYWKTGLKNLGNTCYLNAVIQCL